MATLIPNYKWTDFLKVAKMGKLEELKNGEVTFNGEYLFTFVNGHTEASGFLRCQAEYNCQTANAVGGKTLEDILAEFDTPKTNKKRSNGRKKVHAIV